MKPHGIVLLGPSGAGKTRFARVLSDKLGLSYIETEARLLERYGSREGFLQNKQEALAVLEDLWRGQLSSSGAPAVLEASGLSDEPTLRRLEAEFALVYIKIWAPPGVCAERVCGRPIGANLNADPEATRLFCELWDREVASRYDYELELDTSFVPESEMLRLVRGLLEGGWP